MPGKAVFIVLNSAVKQRIVCDLAEKCYIDGKRLVLSVKDAREGEQLDRLLWTWKQSSFVPHIYTDLLSKSSNEPILLTPDIESNPDYDILLMSSPQPLQTIEMFGTVIDFAEKYDLGLIEESRKRYKLYREKKIEIQTMQPGEYLRAMVE